MRLHLARIVSQKMYDQCGVRWDLWGLPQIESHCFHLPKEKVYKWLPPCITPLCIEAILALMRSTPNGNRICCGRSDAHSDKIWCITGTTRPTLVVSGATNSHTDDM